MRKIIAILMALALMSTMSISGCGGEPAKEVKTESGVKKEEPAKVPEAAGKSSAVLSCYEVGFRTGRCAAKSMSGLPCDPADEIPIPPECKGKPDTDKGNQEGRRSVY